MVLNISRIDTQKNQMSLVEAFADLAKIDRSAQLVLIGPETQPDYAEKLRQQIRELNLNAQIKMLPGLKHDDPSLLDAYQAADVFVLPSMHEPFGIVVLEAWSAGKPVISSHVGGLKRLIEHGRTGLFFHETAELSAQLRRLHGDKAECAYLAACGRNEALHHYDWRRINQQLEDLYKLAESHHQKAKNKASILHHSAHAPRHV
jgi:glycosyltransferase involved in cell wall biosynthesis